MPDKIREFMAEQVSKHNEMLETEPKVSGLKNPCSKCKSYEVYTELNDGTKVCFYCWHALR